MTPEEAIAALNALNEGEEVSHLKADGILLKVLENNGLKDVADAWEAARIREDFWYS